MAVMAKKKPADRHRHKPFQLRMNESLRAQLEKLADRRITNVTALIITAVREMLERERLWPPDASE